MDAIRSMKAEGYKRKHTIHLGMGNHCGKDPFARLKERIA